MGKRAYVLLLLSLIFVLSSITIAWAVVAESPQELMVVRANDNSLWKATCSGSPSVCTGFSSFPGMFASTPTVTWNGKTLRYEVWGRASDSTIWKATFDKNGNFYNDWVSIPGSTPSQIGGVGSNLSYPYNNWIIGGSIAISSLAVCSSNTYTQLGSAGITAPSTGYINVFASGIFAPTIANAYVRVCISGTSGTDTSCNTWDPYLESDAVNNPYFEGERRWALHHVFGSVPGNTSQSWYLKACREDTSTTGTFFWDDVIGIFTK
jgi:hypothetical protein